MKNTGITVQQFKDSFNKHYPHISIEVSDKEIYEFLKRQNFQGINIPAAMDRFSDYLLSQGLCEVQE